MDFPRIIAGVGMFTLAVVLAVKGQTQEALYLALPSVGFFIGETNGKKKTAASSSG